MRIAARVLSCYPIGAVLARSFPVETFAGSALNMGQRPMCQNFVRIRPSAHSADELNSVQVRSVIVRPQAIGLQELFQLVQICRGNSTGGTLELHLRVGFEKD